MLSNTKLPDQTEAPAIDTATASRDPEMPGSPFTTLRHRAARQAATKSAYPNTLFKTPTEAGTQLILPSILVAALIYAGPMALLLGAGIGFASGYAGKWLKDECENHHPKPKM